MKSQIKNSFSEVLANPISRNLVIIFAATLVVAIALVTTAFLIFEKYQ
jgi:uncharacterized membrane protein